MANIYDPEEVKGELEIELDKNQKPGDVRDKFSLLVRKAFRDKGQRVKDLFLEMLEEDVASGKVVFHFAAEVYDYDFAETDKFWRSYKRTLQKGF